MKIAITSTGDTLDAPVDQRFGRARNIIVYDLETDNFEVTANTQNLNAAQGAGVQTGQNVVNSGATNVITGHCGPKAFRLLEAAGIGVCLCESGTVREAIASFKAGEIEPIHQADVDGHWV